jgi:hypothetical protein
MDRRRFLLTSLAGVLAAPFAPGAQPAGKVYRIGILGDKALDANKTLLWQTFRASAGVRLERGVNHGALSSPRP